MSFEDEAPSTLPDVYYYRAPSALFHAHVGLADLYRKLGDFHGAEEQANRCIALAPTVAAGYAIKSDALACRNRFTESANVAMDGLRATVTESDCAMLLFNLALLFRRVGKRRESDALLVYVATLSGIYADRALEIVEDLAGGTPSRAFAYASLPDAKAVIASCGIPLVTDRMRNALIARAALGLTNAHAPNAAAPYVELLMKRFPDNRAILGACNSILHGLG